MTGDEFRDSLVSYIVIKEDCMSLNAHLEELKKKHTSLSSAVEKAQRAPGIDQLELASMKKQKLKLKQEIARLSG